MYQEGQYKYLQILYKLLLRFLHAMVRVFPCLTGFPEIRAHLQVILWGLTSYFKYIRNNIHLIYSKSKQHDHAGP